MAKRFLKGLLSPFVTIEDDPIMPSDATPKSYVDERAIPIGGQPEQVLCKQSTDNFDLTWKFPHLAYIPTGLVDNFKIWTGTAQTNSSGFWSINFNNAGFTTWIQPFVQAESDTDNLQDQRVASVKVTSSRTRVEGYVMESNSLLGILPTYAFKYAGAGARVNVLIIGV